MYNSPKIVYLKKSDKPESKYMVLVDGKTIYFGQKGASDYTKNKDPERKRLYISRHQKNENWKLSGINSPAFWSRWLNWNKPTLTESIKDTEFNFNLKIKRTKWPNT